MTAPEIARAIASARARLITRGAAEDALVALADLALARERLVDRLKAAMRRRPTSSMTAETREATTALIRSEDELREALDHKPD